MEIEKKKYIIDIFMAVIVFISLVISFRSCMISKNTADTAKKAIEISKKSNQIAEKANQISKKALEKSRSQFLQINRPYIIINPKKFESGEYWEVTQQGNKVLISLKYEIKNVGKVAAKNISVPDKVAIGPKMKLKDKSNVIYNHPEEVSLGPGDDFVISSYIQMEYENDEEAETNLAHLKSEKSEGVTFLLSVNYMNPLDISKKYRTFMENRIHNNEATILKSEMVMLNEK